MNTTILVSGDQPEQGACTHSSQEINSSSDPREQLAKLGKNLPKPVYNLIQHYLSWQTGKAHSGQKPIFKSSRGLQLFTSLTWLFGGATASVAICHSSPIFFPLLVVSFAFSVGGARKGATEIIHYCVHKQFFGDVKRDRVLCEMLSILLLIQDYEGYKRDHMKFHHDVNLFATEQDPDYAFLLKLGFTPDLADKQV